MSYNNIYPPHPYPWMPLPQTPSGTPDWERMMKYIDKMQNKAQKKKDKEEEAKKKAEEEKKKKEAPKPRTFTFLETFGLMMLAGPFVGLGYYKLWVYILSL